MAIRTYIPAILTVAKYMKTYVSKNSERLQKYMGDGLYAVVVLVVDLLIIVAELIGTMKPPGDQWSDATAINTLTATTLNDVEAAIAKFYASIGVTP